jgi:acyl carrier protein
MPAVDEDAVRARVRQILLDLAPERNPPDEPDLDLEQHLGYNSLAVLEAVVTLEDELGLVFTDDGPAGSIRTVADVENHVVELLRHQTV